LGCRIGPPGWESIPGLLKRFTNTGSGSKLTTVVAYMRIEQPQLLPVIYVEKCVLM